MWLPRGGVLTDRLKQVIDTDAPAFNSMVEAEDLPAVILRKPERRATAGGNQ